MNIAGKVQITVADVDNPHRDTVFTLAVVAADTEPGFISGLVASLRAAADEIERQERLA